MCCPELRLRRRVFSSEPSRGLCELARRGGMILLLCTSSVFVCSGWQGGALDGIQLNGSSDANGTRPATPPPQFPSSPLTVSPDGGGRRSGGGGGGEYGGAAARLAAGSDADRERLQAAVSARARRHPRTRAPHSQRARRDLPAAACDRRRRASPDKRKGGPRRDAKIRPATSPATARPKNPSAQARRKHGLRSRPWLRSWHTIHWRYDPTHPSRTVRALSTSAPQVSLGLDELLLKARLFSSAL